MFDNRLCADGVVLLLSAAVVVVVGVRAGVSRFRIHPHGFTRPRVSCRSVTASAQLENVAGLDHSRPRCFCYFELKINYQTGVSKTTTCVYI